MIKEVLAFSEYFLFYIVAGYDAGAGTLRYILRELPNLSTSWGGYMYVIYFKKSNTANVNLNLEMIQNGKLMCEGSTIGLCNADMNIEINWNENHNIWHVRVKIDTFCENILRTEFNQ